MKPISQPATAASLNSSFANTKVFLIFFITIDCPTAAVFARPKTFLIFYPAIPTFTLISLAFPLTESTIFPLFVPGIYRKASLSIL
jgi:hypothetical protein